MKITTLDIEFWVFGGPIIDPPGTYRVYEFCTLLCSTYNKKVLLEL